jgi:hypothetical protein
MIYPFFHNTCKDQKYPPLVLAWVRLKFEQNLQCLVSSCKDCFPLKGVCKLVGKILTMPLSCIALAQKVSLLSWRSLTINLVKYINAKFPLNPIKNLCVMFEMYCMFVQPSLFCWQFWSYFLAQTSCIFFKYSNTNSHSPNVMVIICLQHELDNIIEGPIEICKTFLTFFGIIKITNWS